MLSPERLWYLSCRAHQKRRFLIAKALKLLNYVMFHCLLPFEAQIEKDVMLKHWALGVVIHPNVTIGHNVTIYHHVTMAAETWIGSPHRIIVEDDVMIGVGAILIGNEKAGLRIGAGAHIGAGAVVVHSVAPGQTVVGVPARPIRTEPSKSAPTASFPVPQVEREDGGEEFAKSYVAACLESVDLTSAGSKSVNTVPTPS